MWNLVPYLIHKRFFFPFLIWFKKLTVINLNRFFKPKKFNQSRHFYSKILSEKLTWLPLWLLSLLLRWMFSPSDISSESFSSFFLFDFITFRTYECATRCVYVFFYLFHFCLNKHIFSRWCTRSAFYFFHWMSVTWDARWKLYSQFRALKGSVHTHTNTRVTL